MAKLTYKFVNNDVICLVSPNQVLIARFVNLNEDGTITVFKPSTITIQRNPNGTLGIGLTDYSEGNFLAKRDMRIFDPENFVTVDKAEAELATHFNGTLSGVKAVPKPKLIGL